MRGHGGRPGKRSRYHDPHDEELDTIVERWIVRLQSDRDTPRIQALRAWLMALTLQKAYVEVKAGERSTGAVGIV